MPCLSSLLVPLVAVFAQIPDRLSPVVPSPNKVVVKVNGVPILVQEILPLLWDWRSQEVTQDIVTYRLLTEEAKRLKLEPSRAEIEAQFEKRREEYRSQLTPGQDLDEFLRQNGFPQSRLYIRAHTELLMNRIAMHDFRPGEFVYVRTVLFEPGPSQLRTPLARAEEACQKLSEGRKWSDVVKDSDLDDESKSQDGLLGWRAISVFPENARNQVGHLQAGASTRPVAMPDGSVQIFLVEMKGAEAKETSAQELQDSYLRGARGLILQRLRAAAKIEKG